MFLRILSVVLSIGGVATTLCPSAGAQSLLSSDINTLALDDVEITPDQRYAVVRENDSTGFSRVYDLSTGLLAVEIAGTPSSGLLAGECLDAVAVTNTRAIVLGTHVQILRLDTTPPSLLAQHNAGYLPRDVAISPDGTIAAVRGGSTAAGLIGGSYLYDLASGAQIGFAPGEPPVYGSGTYSFDTDAVALTDRHAVVTSLSFVGTRPRTRVTIFDLHPPATPTVPAVVFDSATSPGAALLFGAPHDVALSPDGTRAVVRSEYGLGVYRTQAALVNTLFQRRLFGNPGSFQDEALDSVEVSNEYALTISNVQSAPGDGAAQLDVFDFSGGTWHAAMNGKPHDLALSPDGRRLVVRTKVGVYLFDLRTAPGGNLWPVAGFGAAPAVSTQYQGGLDSIAASNDACVAVTRAANLVDARAHFYSIANFTLQGIGTQVIPNTRPIDVVLTPDRRKAVISGNSSVSVYHLNTAYRAFQDHPIGPNAYYQWCDGVAASADKAVAIAQSGPQHGWIDVVDMTPYSTSYCVSQPSSIGRSARIGALGNASVSQNSLLLVVDDAPRNVRGRFVYGSQQAQLPFGDGWQCVGSPVFGLRTALTNAAGSTAHIVDYVVDTFVPILPGSTWHFQYLFEDPNSVFLGFNSTDALSVTFVP